MESQAFVPAAYSLLTQGMIPPDDLDDEDEDYRWMEYCRIASTLSRDDILAVVLEELDSPTSPLYDVIDSAIESPHEPGRPKESVTELARLGKVILTLVAKAVDDAVGLRMSCQEVTHG